MRFDTLLKSGHTANHNQQYIGNTQCSNNFRVANIQAQLGLQHRQCRQFKILCNASAQPKTESIPEIDSNNEKQKQPESQIKPIKKEHSMSTKVLHAGEHKCRPKVEDTITTPIAQTSSYWFKDTAQLLSFLNDDHQSFEYGRYGNPTTRTLEMKIAELECTEDCLVSSSGMTSACIMLLALVPVNGHIITTHDCYRRTRQFIQNYLPRMGITTTIIDPSDLEALEQDLKQHKTTLFFSESPTNPYLRFVDVDKVVSLCHEHGCIVAMDATFATPINWRPAEQGCDLVVQSATKYLGGHNDVLGGSISGSKELIEQVKQFGNIIGGVMDPHAAYLILRGIKTLNVRVKQQNETAMTLAERLENHPAIQRVHYPGLRSHPDHEVASRYMSPGFGGVISFETIGGIWDTAKVIDGVRIPYIAPSLGGVESLIEQPSVISYWDQGEEGRKKVGIKDNLIRYSAGIEDVEDLWHDLNQSLNQLL